MIKVISDYIGNERKPFLVMDVDPSSGFKNVLGARYAAVSGYLNFASSVGYFLKVNDKNTYYFDIDGIKQFIDGLDRSAVVFGFTYILYSEVVQPLTQKKLKFSLPKGSKVIHIGGWKKLESQKVDKHTFNRMTAELFGIDETDVIDVYGFTEQMGLNYPECQCGCKHTPLYSEVLVRDVTTKKVLPPNQPGLLEFLSPVPHSYPGNAILTDDIGIIEDGICPYGRSGTRFKVIGRLKKAEIRGCGDILSEKLKFSSESVNMNSQSTRVFYQYYEGQKTCIAQSPEHAIIRLEKSLREQLDWIMDQPIDALIGLIAKVANKWQNSEVYSNLKLSGIIFLTAWCATDNLIRLANEGLRGNRHYVDGFYPVGSTYARMMRATSRGLVCHFLAGNVPVLGMFVLIQSILTKNVNLLRVSRRDNGTFENLLSAFSGESFTTAGGYTIRGDDLLRTIAVVSFDHADKIALGKMSSVADVRVAWGGAEAVSTVAAFPAKFDCTDLIMGPKLSLSVVAKEAVQDEHQVKKLVRKIAVDASVFDQTGCASTHNVFVESGGGISPSMFASYLAKAMERVAVQIPKGEMTAEEVAAIHSARGIFDFKGIVYGDDNARWTVLYEDEAELNSPIYSRVVFVHAIDSLNDVLEFISNDIQTIGLAANGAKATDFASKAARKGAIRFPLPGRMLNYETPWDGMFVMDRLIRWNTLGGPLV